MSAKDASTVAPGGLRGLAGERIAVLVLLLVTAFLAWVRFGVIPGQDAGADIEWDFRNPMLQAQPGDCVRGQSSIDAGTDHCLVVRETVVRPASGPARLPGYLELQRFPPYLVLDMHTNTAQEGGCASGPSEVVLRSLNGFGMDPQSKSQVLQIQPLRASFGDREDIYYQVILRRFDIDSIWHMYLSPDMPVTGVVVSKEFRPEKREPAQQALYREASCR